MQKTKCLVYATGLVIIWFFMGILLEKSKYTKSLLGKKFHESLNFLGTAKEPDGSEVLPRIVLLTSLEEQNVKICVETRKAEYDKSHKSFWPGNTRDVRFTAHSYLNNLSMVIDVGGNSGSDALEFHNRYQSRIIIFEPLPTYIDKLKEKFAQSANVKILGIGLGKFDVDTSMDILGKDGDASSLYSGKNASINGEKVKIRNTTNIFTQIGLGTYRADLLHIDCEGCELDVLESIVFSNIIFNIKHIQFAAHTQYGGVQDFDQRYCKLQEILQRSHKVMYQYKFVWESWELKNQK